MWVSYSDSQAFGYEVKVIKAAALEHPNCISALHRELFLLDTEILKAIAKRNDIRLVYAFGRLSVKRLIMDIVSILRPVLFRNLSHEPRYFVVAYGDDPEIDDIDIIEEPLLTFECPEGAIVIGCYETIDKAEDAMFDSELIIESVA